MHTISYIFHFHCFCFFFFRNEPTKRDVDVLNAIMHIDIDATKYANIHAWKTAMLRYPKEEMDA